MERYIKLNNVKYFFIFTVTFFGFGFFFSCETKINYNKVIKELDTVNFSKFKNYYIHYRSKGKTKNTEIYFIGLVSTNENCAPYIVEINKVDDRVLKIDNKLVLKSCGKDYLKEKDITEKIEKFLKLHIALLIVDSVENIYINPFEPAEPILIKIQNKRNILQYFDDSFVHYKNKWYLKNIKK